MYRYLILYIYIYIKRGNYNFVNNTTYNLHTYNVSECIIYIYINNLNLSLFKTLLIIKYR